MTEAKGTTVRAREPKGRGDPKQRYYTPARVAQQVVDRVLPLLGVAAPRRILEPSCGEGVFLKPLRDAFPLAEINAIDRYQVRQARALGIGTVKAADFLDPSYLDVHDLIIGNPPFKLARQFISKAVVLAPTVVFLLRLGFLAAAKRYTFWQTTRPSLVVVLPRRPSFTGDGGTDRYDYGIFCWRAGVTDTHLSWLPLPWQM